MEKINFERIMDENADYMNHVILEGDFDKLNEAVKQPNYDIKDMEIEIKICGVVVRYAKMEEIINDFVERKMNALREKAELTQQIDEFLNIGSKKA